MALTLVTSFIVLFVGLFSMISSVVMILFGIALISCPQCLKYSLASLLFLILSVYKTLWRGSSSFSSVFYNTLWQGSSLFSSVVYNTLWLWTLLRFPLCLLQLYSLAELIFVFLSVYYNTLWQSLLRYPLCL